jgi:predicted phage baseplate assembly protein
MDDIGRACLRFGDDSYGLLPAAGTTFSAAYRRGNGIRGNVGQESLYHIAIDKNASLLAQMDSPVILVDNPMNAHGGVDAQSIDDVRQHVFSSFSLQERGVTPGDYKEIAEREPDIQKANAVLGWTGSWYTLFLTAEPISGVDFDEKFRCEFAKRMEYFRMAGTDLMIVPPIYVPLEISMTVTVQPNYARKIVRDILREVFSNRQWPDGQRGIFHPANYTFGQPVYLSELYAAAYGVVGVQLVKVDTFSRQDMPYVSGLDEGQLTMDWMEIACLENDSDVPDKGIFRLNVIGGL